MKIGAVFVDRANLAIRLREKGIRERMDFKSFDSTLRRKTKLMLGESVEYKFKAFYRSIREEGLTRGAEGFLAHLKHCGWSVMTRPTKRFADGTHKDAGIDLDLALDAYRLALLNQVQVIAIVTHDSDFMALFQRLPGTCKGIVVGFDDGMARELRTCAQPIYLEDIWRDIKNSKAVWR